MERDDQNQRFKTNKNDPLTSYIVTLSAKPKLTNF